MPDRRSISQGAVFHMKGAGMLVASLRGVNFGFWSHFGYSGQKSIIFSRGTSRLGLPRKVTCLFFKMVSFKSQEKAWPTPRLVSIN